jgi:3-phenylpropionate/trans-cinnamate dioxygenase ferredoxin reductase subunit
MDKFRFVIVGGGMVAGYCLKEMAKLGLAAGDACLISADNVLPYQRPPLSKDFLEDKKPLEKVFANKESFYEESGIAVRLNTTVTALDPAAHTVQIGEERVGYEKLILATGSTKRRLGVPGEDLAGVFSLRSLDDCLRIKEAAAQAKSLVMIGGGFIGTEIAARMQERGLQVTMAFRDERLLDFFFPPEITDLYERRYRDHGVRLMPGAEAAEFVGDGGGAQVADVPSAGPALQAVRLKSGETVAADMAIVAIGVTPNLELAQAAGLRVDDAVTVNELLQTSDPDIYAGGDIISYPDPVFGGRRRVEHEEHARRSGRHLARVLLGEAAPYDYLPLVWSEVYDLSWECWGEWRGADRIVYRGDVPGADFSIWWLKEGRVLGAMITENRHDTEAEVAQQWIKEKTVVEAGRLADDSTPLG